MSSRDIRTLPKAVLHEQMSLGTLFTQLPSWKLMEISILKALKRPAVNASFYLIHCFQNLLDYGIPLLSVYDLLTSFIQQNTFWETLLQLERKDLVSMGD